MSFILTVFFVAQVVLVDAVKCPSDTSDFTKDGYYYKRESREAFAFKLGVCYFESRSTLKYISNGTWLKRMYYDDDKCGKFHSEHCDTMTKPEKEGIYLTGTELPKHDAYRADYLNADCSNIRSFYYLFDTSKCLSYGCYSVNNETICGFFKYEIKDNKITQKFYSDKNCTNSTAPPNPNEQYTFDCDKCFKTGTQYTQYTKYTCSKLDNAKKNEASFVSILLLLSFIFFLF